jgi:hypothetical protein
MKQNQALKPHKSTQYPYEIYMGVFQKYELDGHPQTWFPHEQLPG